MGSDVLNGGAGVDVLIATADANFLLTNTRLTGLGTDTLIALDTASLTSGSGNDVLDARGFTLGGVTLVGGSRNDVLRGTNGNDRLYADAACRYDHARDGLWAPDEESKVAS